MTLGLSRRMLTAGLALLLAACGPKGEPERAPGTAAALDTTPPPVPVVVPPGPAPAPAPAPAQAPPKPAAPRATPAPAPDQAARVPKTTPAPAPEQAAAPPARDQWHPAPRDTLDNDTYQGWKQYELNCARCHGEYAVGTSFAPALTVSLKEGGTIPTKEAFMTVVCAGRPDKGMPGWCALGLEMDKIERMYLYVRD